MSMDVYERVEVIVTEAKVKEICNSEFDNLIKALTAVGASINTIATVERHEDYEAFYDCISDEFADSETKADNLIAVVMDRYKILISSFKEKTGVSLWLEDPDYESTLDADYIWCVERILDPKLVALDAQLQTWVEFG